MNREILFRGKRLDNDRWVEGSILSTKENTYICYLNQFNDDLWFAIENIIHAVIPESVGQYTGLKDKNGNKIFEGDVVRSFYSDGKPCRHIIKFDDDTASFVAKYLDFIDLGSTQHSSLRQDWIIEHNKEVVDNIFDNPELLNN